MKPLNENAADDKCIDVLLVGELLVDMISESYDKTTLYQSFMGGSPSNIASNLMRLGFKAKIASAVGKDPLGDFLIENLVNRGISTEYIQRTDNSTSMVVLGRSIGTPIPVFYRDADYHIQWSETLENTLKSARIFHFSCWPVSRSHSRAVIDKLLQTAANEKIIVGFDPNYHRAIWESSGSSIDELVKYISMSDYIKPSEDDAERIFGKDTPRNQIRKFFDCGAKAVIMTLGKDGLIAADGREEIYLESVADEIVDTTGAGDAFWSGFYAGLLKGAPFKSALKLGNAVSAYKLKYCGAVIDFPPIEKISEIYGVEI